MKGPSALPRLLVLVVAALAACGREVAEAPPAAYVPHQDEARRLAAILDYVAADYGGAVKDGQVASETEFAEQQAFLRDAQKLAGFLGDSGAPVRAEVGRIAGLVAEKTSPETVAQAARSLRGQVVAGWQVVLAPKQAPSKARGAELFAQNCVSCHGATGGGDGPAAANLTPKPRSFRDPAVMEELSPVRAFNALTDGVSGTAMAPFPTLSDSDRWNLAFYVFTIRHSGADVAAGARVAAKAPAAISGTREMLASANDEAIAGAYEKAGFDEAAALQGVAYARSVLAYRSEGRAFDPARRLLEATLAAHQAGRFDEAHGAAAAAYLDGFEPHEGSVKARDAAFVVRVEEAFLGLRQSVDEHAPAPVVEQDVLRLGQHLDRAEELLAGGGGPEVAFAGALVVVLREGLEAALLVLMLLGMARKAGAAEDARAVHAGWGLAALAGVGTWFASGFVEQLGGARRELMEGAVSLLAAVVLLLAGHWVLARQDAKRRVDSLKDKLKAANGTGRRRAVLVTLGFVAVYREAFEVVLFLRAIALDHGQGSAPVALGALVGALLLVGLVVALRKVGNRLKPGPLLTASGTLLCLLAFVLAGKGIRAVQEAGLLGITPIPMPRVDWLGLFPTAQSVLAQLVVLAVFAFVALGSLRGRDKPVAPETRPAAPGPG